MEAEYKAKTKYVKVGSIKNRVPDFQQLKGMEMVKALGATEGDAFPAEDSHRIEEYVKIGGGKTGAIKAPVNEVPEAKEGTGQVQWKGKGERTGAISLYEAGSYVSNSPSL
ncbi:hypothetical protein Gohar_011367 [Gossypium harknessii]|uniref:Uncharacterized protein n=1 Tax=Gossypium harknessii TaxID=34285 RepID=A0A7J9GTQ5_9ROSI|nr:hypothetical protein [Gossypium harknessii]